MLTVLLRTMLLTALMLGVLFHAHARPDIHPEYPTYFAPSNGVSLAYQEFGDPQNPTILLVMGLGAQLIHWGDDFVERLVGKGYHVIRFDNRDAGLSTKLYDAGKPGLFTMLRYQLGLDLGAPYDLYDMADDAIGLLDHLHIDSAHVAGISMGGMIGQIMAARYPERVLSLASIMSTSGAEHLPEGSHEVEFRDSSELSREQNIHRIVEISKAIYAKEDVLPEGYWQTLATRSFDRNNNDAAFARQIWAILQSGDRVELLKTITVPTVVIHGALDPLLTQPHGEHTAELVPDALWVLLEDMGHFMAPEHHERVVNAVLGNVARTTSVAAPMQAAPMQAAPMQAEPVASEALN